MGIIIAIGVICLVLGIAGFFASNKIYDERGVYPIGGPNGLKASQFLLSHPSVNVIFKKMESGGYSEENILKLLQLGAKAVITPKFGGGMLVLTEDAAIAFGETGGVAFGAKGQIFAPLDRCLKYIDKDEMKFKVAVGTETTVAKGKSVVGSAIVGSVVAGGVGAVVGAVAAANHNANNREVTTTKYETRGSGFDIAYLRFMDGNGKLFLDNIYVSDDIDITVSSAHYAVERLVKIISNKDYHAKKQTPPAVQKTSDKNESVEQIEPQSPVINNAIDQQQEILAFLAENPLSTFAMIKNGCPSLRDSTMAEIGRLVRPLLNDGKVIRTEDRNGAYFSIK